VTYFVHSAATDVGRRRSHNEDCFIAAPGIGLFAVIDGSGGTHVADSVNEIIRETLGERVLAGDDVTSAMLAANARVAERTESDLRLRGAAATVTALRLDSGHAQVAHAGDTRCYQLTAGRPLRLITRDHTLVAEQLLNGTMTLEQAESSPFKNVITRAVGIGRELVVDEYSIDYAAGDMFLLCSDGLWREVPVDQIAAELARASIETAARELVAKANALGASDNVTAIVVAVRG
jgi:PPM family protein phosphatase